MADDRVLELLDETAAAVRAALDTFAADRWRELGTRAGQYRLDLVADEAARRVLDAGGVGVLSEESGLHHADRDLLVVVDPVDGSTNASRGIPWFACSLCAVDGGARRDDEPIGPTACTRLADAVVGLSGYPARPLGWRQFRALGAAALDLCAVAAGTLDAYADCSVDAHGPWDYLGGLLVCREAGAHVIDVRGRDLLATGHADRRTPVAAATPDLLRELVEIIG